jgi:hypothetical protein
MDVPTVWEVSKKEEGKNSNFHIRLAGMGIQDLSYGSMRLQIFGLK